MLHLVGSSILLYLKNKFFGVQSWKEMPWSCVYLILQRWSWFIGTEGYCCVVLRKIAVFFSGLQGWFNWWISRSPGVPHIIDRRSWCRRRTAGEKHNCNVQHNLTTEWSVHLTAPIFHLLEKSFSSFSDRSSLSFVPKSDYCILKISVLTIKLIFFINLNMC